MVLPATLSSRSSKADALQSQDANAPIDWHAFEQILELDDDEECAFSKDMIAVYFAQVPEALDRMDGALSATPPDFVLLAGRAHFIAGSSASLGIVHVARACGRIEGVAEREGAGDAEVREIQALLAQTRDAYRVAATWLRKWYADKGAPFADPAPADAKSEDSQPETPTAPTTEKACAPEPVLTSTASEDTIVPPAAGPPSIPPATAPAPPPAPEPLLVPAS
ncbi:Histidine-phosphotransfer domain HPT-domain-containing protein [Mycena kentingensis (nom. inval.)]|nr:Histidine-phosphotransfer domain HPT-domain-containing protein [Mycena kentingensis (nom. inval.)]